MLTNKTALVTGSTSGIGLGIARALAGTGANVVLNGMGDPTQIEEVRRQIADEHNVRVVYSGADMSKREDIEAMMDLAESEFGGVDILVNNAGTAFAGRAREETREHIDATLAVNLTAAMRLAQLVYDSMVERGGGSIVNVSSIAGGVGIGGRLPQASYAASKGGLISLTRELAVQWARDGIRVNAVAPGFFSSEMTGALLAHEKISDFILRNSPLGRTGVPADFDGALLFLASDAGSFTTGQTLFVDGGWTAR